MKRVKQISLDILVNENTDGCELADKIADALEANGYVVLGSAFGDDLTDEYKEHYSNLLEEE